MNKKTNSIKWILVTILRKIGRFALQKNSHQLSLIILVKPTLNLGKINLLAIFHMLSNLLFSVITNLVGPDLQLVCVWLISPIFISKREWIYGWLKSITTENARISRENVMQRRIVILLRFQERRNCRCPEFFYMTKLKTY